MSKKLLYISLSFNLSKFILKSPAKMSWLLLFSNDDKVYDSSSMNTLRLSLVVLGGLYMFPIVIVFDRHPPFISIINPSQCSYMFILHFTSVLYLLST